MKDEIYSDRIEANHPEIGNYRLYWDSLNHQPDSLFTENETNYERIFGVPNHSPYVKDGINHYVVNGDISAVNSNQIGTKAAIHYVLDVNAGETQVVRLRLT